jgi:glycerophosphoryl diester phosphodiesterase
MKLIAHRGLWKNRAEPNSYQALQLAFSSGMGIETDLRSFEGKLYISHDPILDPNHHVTFEELINLTQKYSALPVFLNIKEDGLLPLIVRHKNPLLQLNVVFFDMSVPELVQYANHFPSSHLSTRFSEFETSPSALELCDWIWADAFKKDWSAKNIEKIVKETNKKWTFVSPELHGRNPEFLWNEIKSHKFLQQNDFGICTDLPFEFQQGVNS